MTHKTAQQLKDAGFPQKAVNKFGIFGNAEGKMAHGEWYEPTLSELIEACGDKFGSLQKNNDGTFRVFERIYDGIDFINRVNSEEYPDPEIAVANLYLELNKK